MNIRMIFAFLLALVAFEARSMDEQMLQNKDFVKILQQMPEDQLRAMVYEQFTEKMNQAGFNVNLNYAFLMLSIVSGYLVHDGKAFMESSWVQKALRVALGFWGTTQFLGLFGSMARLAQTAAERDAELNKILELRAGAAMRAQAIQR